MWWLTEFGGAVVAWAEAGDDDAGRLLDLATSTDHQPEAEDLAFGLGYRWPPYTDPGSVTHEGSPRRTGGTRSSAQIIYSQPSGCENTNKESTTMNTPESDHTPDRPGAWRLTPVSSADRERSARLGLLEVVGLSPAGAPQWSSTAFGDAVLQLAVDSDSDAITVFISPLIEPRVSPEDWAEAERLAESIAIRLGFPWPPPDRGTGHTSDGQADGAISRLPCGSELPPGEVLGRPWR